jgi:hypothetical protein
MEEGYDTVPESGIETEYSGAIIQRTPEENKSVTQRSILYAF